MVGESRVAGQHGSVRVGADHPSLDGALGAVRGVADADLYPGQGGRPRAQGGEPAVVLEAGQQHVGAVRVPPPGQDLADRALGTAPGLHVQQAEALDHLVPLADGERAAADLVAGADGEQHRPCVQPPEQVAVGLQRLDRGHLGRVLAATQQVHRTGRRHHVPRLDDGQLRLDAAPLQALDQHHRVAAVAVDAQQRLVHQDDLDRAAHRRPAIFSSAWNGVYVAIRSTGAFAEPAQPSPTAPRAVNRSGTTSYCTSA